MTIRRLAKNIGGSFDLFKFYDYNQEINFFSRLFINKSKVGVKYVKIFQKLIKIFLCIGPNVLISLLLTCFKSEIIRAVVWVSSIKSERINVANRRF